MIDFLTFAIRYLSVSFKKSIFQSSTDEKSTPIKKIPIYSSISVEARAISRINAGFSSSSDDDTDIDSSDER